MKKRNACLCLLFLFSGVMASCGQSEESSSIFVREATGIAVTTKPTKMSYEPGDTFDPTGMVVSLKYNDDTTEPVTGYKCTVADPLTQYTKVVSITYEGYKTNLTIDVSFAGNAEQYNVANTEALSSSPLEGKTYYYLGSSVTYGAQSGGESYADYIAKRNSCTAIKEAVSGTTLGDKTNSYGDSYITRFNTYLSKKNHVTSLDGFVLQLSTNDAANDIAIGTVGESKDIDSFDVTTTSGAIEYLIAKVKEVYNCPFYVYTSPYFENEKTANYRLAVDALLTIEKKWDITVLNMFDDTEFNNITAEQRKLYMADDIHPTKAGYREWWTPKFEEMLKA